MLKNYRYILVSCSIGVGLISYALLLKSSDVKVEEEKPVLISASNTPFIAPDWNKQTLAFAGENIPYNDPEVIERIDREILFNTYRTSYSWMIFKRSARWFPVIEPILKANNIPDDFKYLCITESELTNAVSPAGASGFWQFMKGTAPSYGLDVNDEVDERYDVEKSTQAACKYFLEAYKKFGSWTLVAASYNMGMAGVQNKLIEQQQKSYYDLYLNTETHRYVARILAFKLMFENPKKYGYSVQNKNLYPVLPFKTIEVTQSIPDLVEFAKQQGVSYKDLKMWNPWLRKNSLSNPKGKKYQIRIPEPINYDKAQTTIKASFAE